MMIAMPSFFFIKKCNIKAKNTDCEQTVEMLRVCYRIQVVREL